MFLEVIVAPSYTEGALKMLSFKKDGSMRNVRVLELADISEKQPAEALDLKKVKKKKKKKKKVKSYGFSVA